VSVRLIEGGAGRLAVALCLVAPAAYAAPGAAAAPSFKIYDQNGDGVVSADEFRAQGGEAKAFRAADANDDNRLHAGEFARASQQPFKTGHYVPNALITAEVKVRLQQSGVGAADVDVQTHKGMVLLSGWVSRPQQIARAEKVVRGVRGVSLVSNDLRVRR
jgi:hyperosmotically inducible protein